MQIDYKGEHMKLLEKKVAFIFASNDEQESMECIYYLEQLKIPQGYEKDIIMVQEAPSMTAAYNGAMKDSDAKYKVYIHQDTFVINENFIFDMLELFQSSEEIGAIGCVGCRRLSENAYPVSEWDTGKLYHNFCRLEKYENGIREVDVVDGMLIATQYDIPWREDIFDKWDFYDISQCYEFHRIGKKVVVPKQKECWCYHDNKCSNMSLYNIYRKKFIEEYQDLHPFRMEECAEEHTELEELKIKVLELMETLLGNGKVDELGEICNLPQNREALYLREYREIYTIYDIERGLDKEEQFYQQGEENILEKLRHLKHLVKRVEYGIGNKQEHLKEISESYSVYAACIVTTCYCLKWKKVYQALLGYYKNNKTNDYERMLPIWEKAGLE